MCKLSINLTTVLADGVHHLHVLVPLSQLLLLLEPLLHLTPVDVVLGSDRPLIALTLGIFVVAVDRLQLEIQTVALALLQRGDAVQTRVVVRTRVRIRFVFWRVESRRIRVSWNKTELFVSFRFMMSQTNGNGQWSVDNYLQFCPYSSSVWTIWAAVRGACRERCCIPI